jgi:hypothetical protein
MGCSWGYVMYGLLHTKGARPSPPKKNLPAPKCKGQQASAKTKAACQRSQGEHESASHTCSDSGCREEQAPPKEWATPHAHAEKWMWKIQANMSF